MEIDPDQILRVEFATVRRGYDPLEVQRYLMRIGAELREAREQVAMLESDLDAAIAEAQDQTRRADEMDVSRLSGMLGEETAKVIDAAHEAAEEIRERARVEGEAEREAGRQRAREMVAEARALGESMLAELVRRRRSLRTQIEQLQVARERLLEALGLAQRAISDVTDEIDVALPEAREAALRLGEVLTVDGGDTDTLVRELTELRRLAGLSDLGFDPEHDAHRDAEPDPESEPESEPDPGIEPDPDPDPDREPASGLVRVQDPASAEIEGEQVPAEGDEGIMALRDVATRDIERELSKRIKRVLSDDLNTILGGLTGGSGDEDARLPVDAMGERAAQIERLRAAVVPSLVAAASAGFDLVSELSAGSAVEPSDLAMTRAGALGADMAATRATALATMIVDQLRAAVARCKADGTEGLAEQIRVVFRDWRGPRVDRPASRAVIACFNEAVIASTPTDRGVRWIRCGGSRAREPLDCEPAVGDARADDGCRCMALPANLAT